MLSHCRLQKRPVRGRFARKLGNIDPQNKRSIRSSPMQNHTIKCHIYPSSLFKGFTKVWNWNLRVIHLTAIFIWSVAHRTLNLPYWAPQETAVILSEFKANCILHHPFGPNSIKNQPPSKNTLIISHTLSSHTLDKNVKNVHKVSKTVSLNIIKPRSK